MSWLRLSWLETQAELLRGYRFRCGGEEEHLVFVQRDELGRNYDDDGQSHEEPGVSSRVTFCDGPPVTPVGDTQSVTCPKISTWEAGWNVTNAIQVTSVRVC